MPELEVDGEGIDFNRCCALFTKKLIIDMGSTAMRIVRDKHHADDAVQEACYSLMVSFSNNPRPVANFRAYAMRSVVTVCWKMARDRRFDELLEDQLQGKAGPDVSAWVDLVNCLKKLRPGLQEVLLMNVGLGYSTSEISLMMERSQGTIRNNILAGKKQLRSCMKVS